MKTAATALTIALLATATMTAAPAHAGSDTVTICHSTGAGKYVVQSPSKSGDVAGHAGHQDGADIIPAFNWVDKGVRYYFDGQNLDKLDLLANGCKAPATPGTVTVNAPTYTPATCMDPTMPYGRVTIPENLGDGIASTTPPVLSADGKTWTVTYTLNTDTEDHTYAWPNNQTGVHTFKVVPITEDPLWVIDSKTGEGKCELSDTGAGGIGNVTIAGGLIGLGLLAVAGSAWNNRRNQEAA